MSAAGFPRGLGWRTGRPAGHKGGCPVKSPGLTLMGIFPSRGSAGLFNCKGQKLAQASVGAAWTAVTATTERASRARVDRLVLGSGSPNSRSGQLSAPLGP